jgi:cell wall-associated NlpC family hydrolase
MTKFITSVVIITTLAAIGCTSPTTNSKLLELFTVPISNSSIVTEARKWDSKHYKKGQSLQCANWVGRVVIDAGGTPPPRHAMARSWLKWGSPVSKSAIQPGDIVITWRGSRSGKSGHILIYIGDGQCIHRPTYSRAVCKTYLSNYSPRILGIRR